jgi:hypothetical protein
VQDFTKIPARPAPPPPTHTHTDTHTHTHTHTHKHTRTRAGSKCKRAPDSSGGADSSGRARLALQLESAAVQTGLWQNSLLRQKTSMRM